MKYTMKSSVFGLTCFWFCWSWCFSYFLQKDCFASNNVLALACISWRSKDFDTNCSKRGYIVSLSTHGVRIPLLSSTSSGVAPPSYPKTGTPNSRASPVTIPKLSWAILMTPLARDISFILSSILSIHPTKVIVGPAIDIKYSLSGPSPAIISGVL